MELNTMFQLSLIMNTRSDLFFMILFILDIIICSYYSYIIALICYSILYSILNSIITLLISVQMIITKKLQDLFFIILFFINCYLIMFMNDEIRSLNVLLIKILIVFIYKLF